MFKVEYICLSCKKEFFASNFPKRKFCSFKCGHDYRKGRTFEELYGKEKSNEIKAKISLGGIGKKRLRLKNKKVCLICNKIFESPPSLKQKFCSYKCSFVYRKGKTLEDLCGKERADEIKKKMRNNNKIWMKNKTYEEIYGIERAKEIKAKISKANVNVIGKHYNEILSQIKSLEKQGFRCVPVGKSIPDIIAIKGDNLKVFAVEIETGTNLPNLNKYDITNTKKFFDDIIWVFIKRRKNDE